MDFLNLKNFSIKLTQMTRLEWTNLRGRELFGVENGSDVGYMCEYIYEGELPTGVSIKASSWKPKQVVDNFYFAGKFGYLPTDHSQYSYGRALELLEERCLLARKGWNGKGMYIFLVNEDEWSLELGQFLLDLKFEKLPFIAMKTADGKIVPWLASQTDQLAKDWIVVQ